MLELLNDQRFEDQPIKEQHSVSVAPKKTNASLKLVVSNPSSPQKTSSSQTTVSNGRTPASFISEVRLKGPCFYEMTLQDPSHYLESELTLETLQRKNANTLEPLEVICHFPNISDEKLYDYVWEDECLLGMILIQFQMKILEQILMFCSNQYASNLIIYTDDTQSELLGIYHEFMFIEGYLLPQVLDNSKIIIPINEQTIQKWTEYMNKVNKQFHQTLWREQRLNPAIRQYLKTHLLG